MEWLKTAENGDIIETSTTYPFVNHFGIFIRINNQPFVIHHTPKKGSHVESLNDFFGDRQMIALHKSSISGISENDLIQKYLKGKNKYHVFFYDCEDFVEKITGDDMGFKQMESAAIFVVSALLLYFIFSAKKSIK